MSLNHIEALTKALEKARSAELSDREFQIIVLQGLISLKESHVSLRSRLYNVEAERHPRDITVTEEVSPVQYLMSAAVEKIKIDHEKLKEARANFDVQAVLLYQTYYHENLSPEQKALTFKQAVALLTQLDFKYYGDGKYPLSHYLRECVGTANLVSFPNFVQAISMAVSRPIPLGYKEGFEDMDLDHNDRLDTKEVFNMMKKIGDSCYSWTDVEDFLNSMDMDHDGKMDYAEMLKAFYFTEEDS